MHDPRLMYEFLQPWVRQGVLGESTTFLNFGYWKDEPATWDEAARALARLLGEAANLGSDLEVLDVGFGYGDQDLLWTEQFAPRRIVGLNVTESQVTSARRRVAAAGMSGRIDLRLGSAVECPFEDDSFDRVLALESAMHFPTRERFFREAFRVLRSGGRLALADITLMPSVGASTGGTARSWMDAMVGQVPLENQYDADEYRALLRSAGFRRVSVRSIREHVFGGLQEHLVRRTASALQRWNPLLGSVPALLTTYAYASRMCGDAFFSRYDYVIASADKD
jgi:ubiquinone/menaquinone biosynthesis C-methylase UbiE